MTTGKEMKKRCFIVGVITLLTLFTATHGWAAQQKEYKLPRVIYWGSFDVGAVAYAIPATIAEKIAPGLGTKIRLIPGNDVERLNMLRAGKAHLVSMAADTYWASMALSYYCTFAMGPQPLRVIWAGWPYVAGSTGLVTAASGIKTPYDLKGKRMGVVVGSAWSLEGVKANLAWAKLTMSDVTIVEVSTVGAAYKGLTEGKIDFTMGASNSPGFYEAEASPYGAYLVRYSHDDKDAWTRYQKFMPYHVPGYSTGGATIKAGEKVPTPMYAYPITACLADQSENFVYAITKAFYEKIDDIVSAYPANEAMKTERAITPDVTKMAPFHPGAIKFYKKIGKWNAALEDAQKKKIAHLDKVNKRWAIFTEEAQDRIAKTRKKVDLNKEWRDILEKEIGLTTP